MYASSWFLTLFLTFLPLPVATRIFDIFMYEVRNIQSIQNIERSVITVDMFHLTNCVFHIYIYIYTIQYLTSLQGLEIIFRVGLAILQYNQTDLIQLDMEGMSQVRSCSFAVPSAEIVLCTD